MAGLRAGDIMRGVDLLVDRPDVDAGHVRAAARDVGGVWLLMAAAQDLRIGKIWLDQTPHSLRAALEVPITRDLHDAVIPGFALHWDLDDLVKAMAPRPCSGLTPRIGWEPWLRTWRVFAIAPLGSPTTRFGTN